MLLALAQDSRIRLVGLNQKDKDANAAAFLRELGNPFAAVGADPSGRASIDWGVYGVPETFLVGRNGKIAFKQIGGLTPDAIASGLGPAIEKALSGSAP